MIRYFITDRRSIGGTNRLLDAVAAAAQDGVDWIQLREKDLPGGELLGLARAILRICLGSRTRLLINTRADIAWCAGAAGVHLPAGSPPPRRLRPILANGSILSVACHSLADVERAEQEGADLALLSPIYPPLSKTDDRPPLGLETLREASRRVRIPVLALGGITAARAAECRDVGAAGVAGITLFQAA